MAFAEGTGTAVLYDDPRTFNSFFDGPLIEERVDARTERVRWSNGSISNSAGFLRDVTLDLKTNMLLSLTLDPALPCVVTEPLPTRAIRALQ